MSLSRVKRCEIIREMLKEIQRSPNNPASAIAKQFCISRQTAHKYLADLIRNEYVEVEGQNRDSRYLLKRMQHMLEYSLPGLQEDVVWSKDVKPLLGNLPDNVFRACNYGFTEMLNNAIDHSESDKVYIEISLNALSVQFSIRDDGVGIFRKIQKALSLEIPQHAILELAKGKFTTQPEKHTGEGIFFTARIFDHFYIFSHELTLTCGRKKTGILWEEKKPTRGTVVNMTIEKESDVLIRDVFEQYTAADDDAYGYSKTLVPVRLVDGENGTLVSRSQAKRLTQRVDRFREVVLDFDQIDQIGQGFADELFRVFAKANPNIHLTPINMNEEVTKMVSRAKNNDSN
jgi:anti-sigma regulatory factor (Ser/Thr protein kinase)/predicted transcriptional regulator